MGLMIKGVLVLFLLLLVTIAKPQTQLTSVQVNMVYQQETRQFEVTERLNFDAIKEDQLLTLKALRLSENLEKESLVSIMHSGDGEVGSVIKSDAFQIFQVKFEQAQKSGWIEVKYLIEKDEALTEIPMYFTEFTAASSEEDFFTCDLEMPETLSVYFYFPTATLIPGTPGQGKRSVSFMLPGLPSMIRLELSKDVGQAAFDHTLIDLSVASIFLVIGLLIFRYRNVFMYG